MAVTLESTLLVTQRRFPVFFRIYPTNYGYFVLSGVTGGSRTRVLAALITISLRCYLLSQSSANFLWLGLLSLLSHFIIVFINPILR